MPKYSKHLSKQTFLAAPKTKMWQQHTLVFCFFTEVFRDFQV